MRDRPPDLDLVDHRHLRRIRELERRGRDPEDRDSGSAVAGVGLELGQPERVAVEGERGIQVVGLEHQPQLQTGSCLLGTSSALAS